MTGDKWIDGNEGYVVVDGLLLDCLDDWLSDGNAATIFASDYEVLLAATVEKEAVGKVLSVKVIVQAGASDPTLVLFQGILEADVPNASAALEVVIQ